MNEESLFAAALEMEDPVKRQAFLDAACAGQAALRQRLDRLLAADQRAVGILEHSPVATELDAAIPMPPLGTERIFAGRFKLREKLGEGGMGEVWVADQTEPVQRRVALKVIRAGFDSASMLARFEQERQALALMDHPNIAKVLDAGIDENGRPFFAMELIKGVPITKYCDDAQLSPRQRLELFIAVCHAVQHAHQKGLIHRDLKPSNILIGLYDERPVPKVIDFGVAKATGPRLTEQSVYTEVGALIGTLEYMSPEQAQMNNLDIDTRSDIYALGAVLYELLTGAVPISRKEAAASPFEMLRIIKEVDPQTPSTKLSHSDTLPSVAVARQTEPKKLIALLRGELDWIVIKCLEKDRGRRYQTANGLARDLERYLADEPVEACPPTAGYRLRKFVHKHRTPLLVAGAFLLLLVVGVIVSTWQAVRATVAEKAAQEKEKEAKAYGLVQLVLNVDTPKVPPIIEKMAEYRQWTDPMLREVSAKSPQRLHASLALLPVDAGQVDYLYGRLFEADPRDALPVIRDALLPYKDRLLDRLWAVVENPEQGKESQRLRAAAALAKYDPDSQRWANAYSLANDLLAVRAAHLSAWKEAFRPIGARLYGVEGGKEKAWQYFGKALQRAEERAGQASIIAAAAQLPGLVEKLAESAPNEGPFQAELARHFSERGNHPLANAARTKARAWFEVKLAKEPENAALAGELADLLLIDTTRWTVLRPAEMKSQGGATLTLLDDGSILAGGKNPDRDVYSLVSRTDLKQIAAIRLEALPDSSLPSNGPGRHPDSGNFHLSRLRVFSGGVAVPLTKIVVAYSENSQFQNVINGGNDSSMGWSNGLRAGSDGFRAGRANSAVVATRLQRGADDDLRIDLVFSRAQYTQHNLGCFRLSVTDDAEVLRKHDWLGAVVTPRVKLAAAYVMLGEPRQATRFLTKSLAANPKVPADWLALAWAHARLTELDQARKACNNAVELLQPTGADAALRPLLREALIALGPNSPEAATLLAAAAGKPPAALNEAIRQNPDQVRGYLTRGDWFADRGLWKEASADLAEAFRLEPHTHTGMGLGIFLVYTGAIDRYRAHCRAMLERWASTENNLAADQTLKTILLLPDFKADAKQLAQLAEVAVSGDTKAAWFEWWMFTKGLHDYRTGRYAEALATCRESRRRTAGGHGNTQALASMDLAIEAMALHRLGDEAGAKLALAEAKSNVEDYVPGIDGPGPHDWLIANLLYREAEGLIAGMKAEPPK